MAEKEIKPSKEVQEKIAKACKEVVMQDDLDKLLVTLQQQMSIAKQNFIQSQQQVTLWDTKMKQLSGGIASISQLKQKSHKIKSIELTGDNTKPEKK